MRWAEFIMLRTAANSNRRVYETLKQIAVSLTDPGLVETALYNHASISGDFVLALLWDTEKPRPWGSDLALGIVRELKNLGLVDHSVWTRIGEQNSNDK